MCWSFNFSPSYCDWIVFRFLQAKFCQQLHGSVAKRCSDATPRRPAVKIFIACLHADFSTSPVILTCLSNSFQKKTRQALGSPTTACPYSYHSLWKRQIRFIKIFKQYNSCRGNSIATCCCETHRIYFFYFRFCCFIPHLWNWWTGFPEMSFSESLFNLYSLRMPAICFIVTKLSAIKLTKKKRLRNDAQPFKNINARFTISLPHFWSRLWLSRFCKQRFHFTDAP